VRENAIEAAKACEARGVCIGVANDAFSYRIGRQLAGLGQRCHRVGQLREVDRRHEFFSAMPHDRVRQRIVDFTEDVSEVVQTLLHT
jgi:hypothetical protein